MRTGIITSLLGSLPERARLVDIGSGQGDLVAVLLRCFPAADALGLELSHEGVASARLKAPQARFVRRDLLRSEPVPSDLLGVGELAICSEVLEHVDNPAALLRNARAYLAPGCRLIVTVPGGPRTAFDRHIGHRRHYTKRALRTVLSASGFDVEEVFGAGFPFFNLYKLVVLLRGRRLIEDVASGEETGPARGLATVMMRVFDILFRLNLRRSPWGWQIVGVARVPAVR